MAKNILVASSVKKILEQVWKENDCPVILVRDEREIPQDSCVEFLDVRFYTYKIKVTNGAYALVESMLPSSSAINPDVDYSEKNVKVTILIQAYKADVLEYYVKKLQEQYTGVAKTFNVGGKEFNYYLAFDVLTYDTPPKPEQVGTSITCSFNLKISYTTNAVLSDNEVYLLDGVKLPYSSGGPEINRSGNTNKIYASKFTQTLTTSQTRQYRFRLPSITDNAACVALKRDILSGDLNKVYTLTHYDGVTYTQENPLVIKVTLNQTSASKSTVAGASEFEVIFVETHDQSKNRVFYAMALIDNPFDSGTVNTRWFASQEEQQLWFTNKVLKGAFYSQIKAPNINSLTITQQIYFAPPEVSLDSLLTKNYAVITATDGAETKYYYYFVQSASVGADNQILVDLKMDSIQTYYFNPNIKIADCTINRAHLNRFVEVDSNTVKFNNAPDSPMLLSEGVNFAKRLIKRTPIVFNISDYGTAWDSFFQKHRVYWGLVYIKRSDAIANAPFLKYGINNGLTYNFMDIESPFIVLVAPIFNNAACSIKINQKFGNPPGEITIDDDWSFDWLMQFIKDKNLTNDILNIKITPLCPMSRIGTGYSIDGEKLTIISAGSFGLRTVKAGQTEAVFCLNEQSPDSKFAHYDIGIKTTFIKSDIVGVGYNPDLIPKLLSSYCRELNVVDYMGNSYSYDMQKINADNVDLFAFESLAPDITKGYIRIKDNNNSVYGNGSAKNYTGLVYSGDTGIPYAKEQLDAFLSQNKNYALMQQAQRSNMQNMANIQMGFGLANTALSAGIGLMSGNISALSNVPGAALGALQTQMTTSANISLHKAMENYVLDNMRNAPASISNAQGNILFNLSIGDYDLLSIYVEEYEALPIDLKKIADYYNTHGFAYGRTGSVNDFINLRKYFNYIQADIENIDGISMSSDAKNDIRQRFANGVRFWNTDEVNYDKENYERWLEN